jgi:general secretion pathway protein H
MRASHGFTLIELLVVIALIAIGTGAVSFSLRDSAQTVLERDADRLAAFFESARARSRASGMPVKWYPQTTGVNPNGFVFDGLPSQTLPDKWLSPQIQVAPNSLVILGPDPIIGPQSVQLRMRDSQMWVSTDGLKPFAARRAAP